MNRRLLLAAFVGVLAVGAWSAAAQDFPTTFKNLQVFDKKIAPEALKGTMNSFTDELGVKCTFCHSLDDYSKDANEHKLAARKMIALVQFMKLNKAKYFKPTAPDELISCGTCHRGQKEPVQFVPED